MRGKRVLYKKIIIIMGLSGTGKSFLSKLISENFGYIWIRSDIIRKRLIGIDPSSKVNTGYMQGIYTPEVTRVVYYIMFELAKTCIKKGKCVVIDATFSEKWQRNLALKYFPKAIYIQTVAPENVVKKRISSRIDVSDANYAIYLKQKERWTDPDYAIKINTNKSASQLLQELKSLIKY